MHNHVPQTITVETGADISRYTTVVVHCKFLPHREPRSFDVMVFSIRCNTWPFFVVVFFALVSRTSCATLVLCLSGCRRRRSHTRLNVAHFAIFVVIVDVVIFFFLSQLVCQNRVYNSVFAIVFSPRVFAAFEKQRIRKTVSISNAIDFLRKKSSN